MREDHIYFIGDCTCDHTKNQHGWGACGEGECPCQAGWEE